MSVLALVKAHQCYPFTSFMESSGMPVARMLERFRLPVKLLEAGQLYVDESRLWQLIEHVGHAEGVPDLGYRVGRELRLEKLGEFGELLLSQPTLKRAIEVLSATISSEAVVSRFTLEKQYGTHWLIHSHIAGAPQCSPMMEMYNLQCLLRVVQSAAGRHWLPPAIQLRVDKLPAGVKPQALTTGEVHFSSPDTGIAVPGDLLPMPMNSCIPGLLTESGREGTINALAPAHPSFSTSVCWLIRGYLEDNLTIHDVSELIDVGERTIQRRLAKDGTSFQEVLDRARFEEARRQLRTSDERVTEIALDLGYADVANFSRAFKRWAGVSPRHFRRTSLRSQ